MEFKVAYNVPVLISQAQVGTCFTFREQPPPTPPPPVLWEDMDPAIRGRVARIPTDLFLKVYNTAFSGLLGIGGLFSQLSYNFSHLPPGQQYRHGGVWWLLLFIF
jgi:hypothetical protein